MIAPPLLVSFSSLDDYLKAMGSDLRDSFGNDITHLFERGLPPVVSSRCLALLFGYSTPFVNTMARNYRKYYRTFTILQGGKQRIINAPRVSLKIIQKWFGHHLAEAIKLDPLVFGFVTGKSAPLAALHHVNAKWVYSVDIKDFFNSTPSEQVTSALTGLGYSIHATELLIGLLCYKDYLPQGSPASPVLSNLVFQKVDAKLKAIAQKHDVRFTRYADDIVFSGIDNFPDGIMNEVKELFTNTCWQLSKEKEYFAELPKRLKVHGLLVHQDLPRLTKGYRNKIRAYKHLVNSNKVNENDLSRLLGHINYANSIDKLNQETMQSQQNQPKQVTQGKGARGQDTKSEKRVRSKSSAKS